MLNNIAIPVQIIFLLAFQINNATKTAMIKTVIINRKTHRHHFHAGWTLAI